MKVTILLITLVAIVSNLSARGNDGNGTQLHPKILFHGGGGGAPDSVVDLSELRLRFEEQGFHRKDIYQVKYPHTKNIEEIVIALRPQMKAIMSQYPVNTTFDVIGHSLGHVVSLVSMTKMKLLSRMRKLIGLAGVMFGQYGHKPGFCRFSVLSPYYCGDIFDLLLGTNEPPFLMELLKENAKEIDIIEKCSLFSPDDGILDPYDSGAFKDGINISIPKVRHLKFKSSPRVFSEMKQQCFQSEF